jgi:hypothetical protein
MGAKDMDAGTTCRFFTQLTQPALLQATRVIVSKDREPCGTAVGDWVTRKNTRTANK